MKHLPCWRLTMKTILQSGTVPRGYTPTLGPLETQQAMTLLKKTFARELGETLSLIPVIAPGFLATGTGLQDDLAGTQTPVSFMIKASGAPVEIVHSLAKWKRQALGSYSMQPMSGILTDMHAVRKDEDIDETHSIAVDQWDWEMAIRPEERTLDFLKRIVERIYMAIRKTEETLAIEYPALIPALPEKIIFVHAEDLEKEYPYLSPREREDAIAKRHGAVFLIGIGYRLSSGMPHDLRAADYDDWSTSTGDRYRGLNGDIIVWDGVRRKALELSSMGIRVDKSALLRQLSILGLSQRKDLPFHKGIIDGTLPQSIGGGIGQSRLAMLLLKKAHIAEVQASVWPEETMLELALYGIILP